MLTAHCSGPIPVLVPADAARAVADPGFGGLHDLRHQEGRSVLGGLCVRDERAQPQHRKAVRNRAVGHKEATACVGHLMRRPIECGWSCLEQRRTPQPQRESVGRRSLMERVPFLTCFVTMTKEARPQRMKEVSGFHPNPQGAVVQFGWVAPWLRRHLSRRVNRCFRNCFPEYAFP